MSKNYFPFLLIMLVSIATCAQPVAFLAKGIGGGGALFMPRINPGNDNDFYVACDMSEMFHSLNFGDSYSQLHYSGLQTMDVSTYEFTNVATTAYSYFNDGNN